MLMTIKVSGNDLRDEVVHYATAEVRSLKEVEMATKKAIRVIVQLFDYSTRCTFECTMQGDDGGPCLIAKGTADIRNEEVEN